LTHAQDAIALWSARRVKVARGNLAYARLQKGIGILSRRAKCAAMSRTALIGKHTTLHATAGGTRGGEMNQYYAKWRFECAKADNEMFPGTLSGPGRGHKKAAKGTAIPKAAETNNTKIITV